jgi:hypothetical protein
MAVSHPAGTKESSRPVVLMGFAEAMAAIETAWSLQGAGYKVAAFRRAGSRPAVRHVRGVQVHEVPSPETDADASAAAVAALADALRPAAVLPLDDNALWICGQLASLSVPLAGAFGESIGYALDKSRHLDAASRAGLPVPPTNVLDNLADIGPVQFPVMIKPARAVYKVNGALHRPSGVICADSQELTRATARPWPGPLLVQPLIRGTGEGLFGHVGRQGVIGWSSHRRVRMVNPQGSASSACRSNPVDEHLLEPSERFLKAIGWRGMFMLEFLRDTDGKPWLMELNGRAWGSMALARRRGFEYPAWTVKATLERGFEPTPPPQPPELTCRNLGMELVHLMFVARGPQSDAVTEWPRLSKAVRDVCGFGPGDRLYNWNRSQPQVLAADTLGMLGRYAQKAVRRRR